MTLDEALIETAVKMNKHRDDDRGWELAGIALQFAIRMLYRLGFEVCHKQIGQ